MQTEEQHFRQIVSAALDDLCEQIDAIDSDDIDARVTEGVLQVEFDSGGVFVLSQQVPVQELWLSAFSHAWHFKRVDGAWIERDSHEPMRDVLSANFSRKLGRPIALRDPG